MEKSKTPTERTHKTPQTLLEAVRYFADEDVAHSFAARLRWPDGPTCPRCGCKEYSYLTTRKLWKCKERTCRYQYSLKKNSIFEDSPLGFDKWLPAVWLVVNCKNGISSHELARALGIHQESAWHMLHRIRLAMQQGSFTKLSGEVEADETFIGGAARNMHAHKRCRKIRPGAPHDNKTIVLGILERKGAVHATVIPNRGQEAIQPEVRKRVLAGSAIYSDKLWGYDGLAAFNEYDHRVIDHAVQYVDGRVHTNGVENFWSLLKRSLKGTYISVEPFHLFRYIDEQVFRFNARHDLDDGRFATVMRNTEGKHLTYEQLKAGTKP